MTEQTLKPCPFCGSEAQMIHGTGGFFDRVQIDCTHCRNATWWWDEAVAVKLWNTRTPSAPAVDAQSERETVPKWVFDGMTKTLEPAWNYIQTHQEQFGAMAGDDKTKIIVDEFVKHFASESVAIGALDEREAPAPGFIASAKTISAVSAALGAVREYANDRVADQMNRAVNLLLDELGQARAALSASTEAAAGKPIWPVPLTLDHSHVLAHCIELQFEDEEDADQFFSMYSAAMGNAAVTGEPVTLTHEELRFVELVRDNPGRKLNGGEAFGESGDALWKRLESLGLIECVGGYKWRLKIAPPSAASGQKLTDDAELTRVAEEIMKGMRAIALWEARRDFAVRMLREWLTTRSASDSATASDKEGA